jgi:ubiquinone/menaquinone biosynthesis C-methylase UbiE
MLVDFGTVATAYAQGRPTYPSELFQWLASIAPENTLAVDCACGCGEATVGIAPYFQKVIAMDASEKMLAMAFPIQNAEYRVAAAERTGLSDRCVDLITVAMAVHWFDQPAFGKEALRILKPGGVLCVWSYGEPFTDDPDINLVLRQHAEAIYHCGPPNLRHVRDGYSNLTVFSEDYTCIDAHRFTMKATRSLEQFITYNRTRSSVRAFSVAHGLNLADYLAQELEHLWRGAARDVYWPMALKAGRKAIPCPELDGRVHPAIAPQSVRQPSPLALV